MGNDREQGKQAEPIKGRKLLFIDIAGVLNESQSRYCTAKFDADKVGRLRRIVESTGCEVWLTPTFEETDGGNWCKCYMATLTTLGNMLTALGIETHCAMSIEEVLGVIGHGDGILSYCVVKYHEGRRREWAMTFGGSGRYVYSGWEERQILGDGTCRQEWIAGLRREHADMAISILNTMATPAEYPLKVVYLDEALKAAKARGEGLK